jgi:vanillate O-demethylase monooxygenase subunit
MAHVMEDAAQTAPDPVREGITTTGTVRNWPKNCWWVAAHGSELGEKPILRWVLELPVALYRTADGSPAALHNRCPHRWAPLSMGEVQGDRLVCPYHGLQFGSDGQCLKVPTQDAVPPAIRVRAFPVRERYGFIWVWTGDIAKADPALIPDMPFLEDPEARTVWGYKVAGANYMQLKENVLDLTHFAFLHAKSLGITDWDRPPEVETTATTVTYLQKFEMKPLAPVYAVPAGKPIGKLANRDNCGRFASPAVNYGAVNCHDPKPEPGGLEHFSLYIIHLTTPVSIAKTHYYWAMARDHGPPFDVEATRALSDIVFGEDIAMAEAMQSMAQRSVDQDEAKEFSVAADRAAIEARRRILAMVKAEQDA